MVGPIDKAVEKGRRLSGDEVKDEAETEVEEEADAQREAAEPEPAGVS
jgi:hypothetical protein